MSTRGTFKFTKTICQKECKTFIYMHYDCYPEGVANYLYQTIIHQSKGSFATQFIRCIAGAEITLNHEVHADSDYQYDITGTGLDATIDAYRTQRDTHEVKRSRLLFYTGMVHQFCSNFSKGIPDFHPFHQVKMPYGREQLLNLPLAKRELSRPLSNLNAWKGKFEGSANWKSSQEEAQMLVNAFPELLTPELIEFGIYRVKSEVQFTS